MLDVEQRSGVTLVRLRHGKVNALDLELLQAITAAMRDADENAAVITGSGTAFSAGVNLRRIVAGGPSYVQEFLPALSGPSWLSLITRGRCSPPSTATLSPPAA